jgi:hypothetical protein
MIFDQLNEHAGKEYIYTLARAFQTKNAQTRFRMQSRQFMTALPFTFKSEISNLTFQITCMKSQISNLR